MNKTLNTWINTMWRVGAIAVDERDDLKFRLNVECEDFETIVADMDTHVHNMSAAYRAKWAALIAANFPRIERAALYAIEEPTAAQWKRLHELDLKLGY